MENIFEKADFTAGSDHKERLRKELFSVEKSDKGTVPADNLSDEELDMVSSVENQEIFLPKKNTAGEFKDGVYSVSVKPLSWNVFVFTK